MCSRDKIIELAYRYRIAILACDLKKLYVTLQHFPCGACGDASYLLAKYLDSNGCGPFDYVQGERSTDGHSHAWLEKEGLIVDITADQFDGQEISVIVTTDRSWHSQFQETERDVADFEKFDQHTVSNLNQSYALIMEKLI
jgi:hypothetical protein